jgi:TRAP-type C4-dicarboxylate transport system permease small subunit
MREKSNGELSSDLLSRIITAMNATGCAWTAVLMLLTVIDVCGRYFFNRPLTGAPEIIKASIVGITFLQIPYVQMINQHLGVTVFYNKMGAKMQFVIDVVANILGAFVFALIAVSGGEFLIKAIRNAEYDGSSASLMLPTWPVRSLILFGSAMMVIIQLKQMMKTIVRTET